MSQELLQKLKTLRQIQREMEWLSEDLDKTKKEIEQMILQEQLVGKRFHLKDRYVVYKKTKTYEGLSQKYIKKYNDDFFRDPRDAEAYMRGLLEGRQSKSRYGLQIISKNPK